MGFTHMYYIYVDGEALLALAKVEAEHKYHLQLSLFPSCFHSFSLFSYALSHGNDNLYLPTLNSYSI